MIKNRIPKKVMLSPEFTLKGSVSGQSLLNLRTRQKFSLERDQYDLLVECDGRKSVAEILADYDQESRKIARKFLKNLQQLGAICLTDGDYRREWTELAHDPQLQSIHFELTSHCNMRCLHCYQESYLHQPTDLTTKEIIKLISDMKRMHVEKIGLSGGEPFMHPDLFEIIEIIEVHEISVTSILTNGLLLTDGVLRKLSRCRSRFPIFISLDGISDKMMKLRGFSGHRRSQAYDRLMNNIRRAIETGFPIMINTVVIRENLSELYQMYDKLRELGVMGWRIALPKRTGAFSRHLTLTPNLTDVFEIYLKIIEKHLQAERRDDQKKFRLQIEHFFRLEAFEDLEALLPTDFVCDYEGKYQSCCIKPNGDVTPCPLYNGLVVGNLRQATLSEIWYSSGMRHIKNIRICDVSGCKSCKLSSLCATGCRANAIFIHGDINEKDDDACAAVKFFLEKVTPVLREYNIKVPILKDQ